MENNIRFRNHVSVILENSLKTLGTLIAIFLFNIISDLGGEAFLFQDFLWVLLIFVGITAIAIGIQTLLWAKTYITIEENKLVIERNTIQKKQNTIGLKNVSNVNLEQNLFEMLLGTCKVKLDTNSLSTADRTDVNIVLKKADAERFRALVLAKAAGMEMGEALQQEINSKTVVEKNTKDNNEKRIKGDLGDIILHGLFSIRISLLFIAILVIASEVIIIWSMMQEAQMPPIGEIISVLFSGFWFLVITLGAILKEFVKYLNFRIERKEDKIYLNYGLFKKIAYSVPVDKINGIRLGQTLIGRLGKRYMVEIINVGMDDDETEVNSFFLPYEKLHKIKEQLHILLPEFDDTLEIKEEKQPAVIWLLSIPWWILYAGIVILLYYILGMYVEEPGFQWALLIAATVIAVWSLIYKLAAFFTKGIQVDERFLKIVNGGFSKQTLLVKYDKIQYVTGNQCILAKRFKIQKGTINLLASMKNRIHPLPYFKESDMEKLKKHLIE